MSGDFIMPMSLAAMGPGQCVLMLFSLPETLEAKGSPATLKHQVPFGPVLTAREGLITDFKLDWNNGRLLTERTVIVVAFFESEFLASSWKNA